MKKIFIMILTICMLGAYMPSGAIAEAATDTDTAYMIIGVGKQNINSFTYGGSNEVLTVDDKKVVQLNKLASVKQVNSSSNGHIYIDIDDNFFCGNSDGTAFRITVEYVDSLRGYFNVKYDGLGDKIRSSEIVYTGAGGEFKEHTFVINDADFKNRINGKYDLDIGFPDYDRRLNKASVQIRGVKIEKLSAENPVMAEVSTDEAGNIFNPQTGVVMHNKFKSYSSSAETVTVSYTAINKQGGVEWSSSENMQIGSGEEKTIDTRLDINRFGLYTYALNITNGQGFNFTTEIPFSYVNTASDGRKNESYGYATNFGAEYYTAEDIKAAMDVIEKSNCGLIRNEIRWAWTERDDGTFNFSASKDWVTEAKARGMNVIIMTGFGHRNHSGNDMNIPVTDAATEAYVNWFSKIVETYGLDSCLDKFKFEIWNEPNLINFGLNSTPEIYANFVYKASTLLKQKYPTIDLGALALTGISNSATSSTEVAFKTREYIRQAAKAGVFNNVKAMSVHPYVSSGSAEKSGLLQTMREYLAILAEEGYPDVKLWNSELGWSTGISGYRPTNREKSAYIPRYYILMDEIDAHEYYCVYDFEKDGNIEFEEQHQFGIVENHNVSESGVPFEATESFVTITNMNNILAGCGNPQRVNSDFNDIYTFRHKNNIDNNDVFTFWRENDKVNQAIRVNLGDSEVTFVDSYGNKTTLRSDDGVYDLMPDFEVSYIIGNFSENITVKKSDLNVSSLNLDVLSEGKAGVEIFGMRNVTEAVVKDRGYVSQDNSSVSGGHINLKLQMPKLNEAKTSFSVLLKDGENIRSVVKLYLNRRDFVGAGFEDNFNDYSYTLNPEKNDRINEWWIETQNNEDAGEYVRVDSITDSNSKTMDRALHLGPTSGGATNSKVLRGGRAWTRTLEVGEKLTVELDLYAEDGADFLLGLSPSYSKVEDEAGFVLFRLNQSKNGTYSEETLYYGSTQSAWSAEKLNGITFVRNEVNHIKVDYTFCYDPANLKRDALEVTVSNSAGENQYSIVPVCYRNDAVNDNGTLKYGNLLTDIAGIHFMKSDTEKNVYIDNVRISSSFNNVTPSDTERFHYLNEGFADFKNGVNDKDKNNRVDEWRIEGGGTNWNGDLSKEELSVEEIVPGFATADVLRISNNAGIARGGRGWNGSIGAGEKLTFEFDFCADKGTQFGIGAVQEARDFRAEEGTEAYFFFLKPNSDTASDTNEADFWYNSDQGTSRNPRLTYPDIKFMYNEVNHIKVEYIVNDDVSAGTKDTMTLTVTNSKHPNGASSTINPNYRYADFAEGQTYRPQALTGIRGISFMKWDCNSTIYMDNISVYKDKVTYPTAKVIDAGNKTDKDNTIQLQFGKKMSSFGLHKDAEERITVTCDGKQIPVTGALDSTGTVYTLTAEEPFKGGREYIVTVPAAVTDNAAIPIKETISESFVPKATASSLSLVQNGEDITVSAIKPGVELTVRAAVQEDYIGKPVTVIVAGYDENARLKNIKMTTENAGVKTVDFKTQVEQAASYKVFLWRGDTMQPCCASLK